MFNQLRINTKNIYILIKEGQVSETYKSIADNQYSTSGNFPDFNADTFQKQNFFEILNFAYKWYTCVFIYLYVFKWKEKTHIVSTKFW